MLCNPFFKCRQLKLKGLGLDSCFLTDECIPSLCELFKDKYGKLTFLDVGGNDSISVYAVLMLYEDVLTNDHCKLARLNVLFIN